MPELNQSQAARLFGKSRMTIHRHCNSGHLSSRLSEDGQRLIDLSELIRAYGEPPHSPDVVTPRRVSHRQVNETGDTIQMAALLAEIQALRAEVTLLHKELKELRALPAPSSSPAKATAEEEHASTEHHVAGFEDLLKRWQSRRGR